MTHGPDGSGSPMSIPPPSAGLPTTRWSALRAALALAASPPEDQREAVDLHAILNLLNRLTSAGDDEMREDLISRLADYLVAVHRVRAGPECSLSDLCEVTRSYASMRYFLADAIEPRLEYFGPDIRLRSLQVASMTGFLQNAVDSLMDEYIPRIEISLVPRYPRRVELCLAIERAPGSRQEPPPGWAMRAGATRHTRTARFVALVQRMSRG